MSCYGKRWASWCCHSCNDNIKCEKLSKEYKGEKMKNFKGVEFVLFWSEEDNCFIANVNNDFIGTFKTHGDSLEETLKSAKEVLELAFEDDDVELKEMLKAHPHKVVFSGFYRGER